jgi:hypothetical protein
LVLKVFGEEAERRTNKTKKLTHSTSLDLDLLSHTHAHTQKKNVRSVLQERAMTLMTEQRGRGVSIYGQTVAMAALMEELSESNDRAARAPAVLPTAGGLGGAGAAGLGLPAPGGAGGGGGGKEASSAATLLAVAKSTVAAAAAPLANASVPSPADDDAGLPPLLLAPAFAPGITMTAPPAPPITPPSLVDDDFFGVRLAEIPDWIQATFALEARWDRLEELEARARERTRLSEAWAPPAEHADWILDRFGRLGEIQEGVPDGEPGGSGFGAVDPLMRLMEGVLPGVDDAEFGSDAGEPGEFSEREEEEEEEEEEEWKS